MCTLLFYIVCPVQHNVFETSQSLWPYHTRKAGGIKGSKSGHSLLLLPFLEFHKQIITMRNTYMPIYLCKEYVFLSTNVLPMKKACVRYISAQAFLAFLLF